MLKKTKETIDEDGWLHSGDIGCILPGTNALKIVDRRKNIFKLSIGEYIAPDKLEQMYKLAKCVTDIFVYGDSLKSVLIGVVNLDEKIFMEMAGKAGISGTFAEIIRTDEGKKVILDDINAAGTAAKVKGFERIKDVHVETTLFDQLGLLTTSFKIKRNEAKEQWMSIMDEMYKKFN